MSKLRIVYYSRHDHSEGKEEEEHSPVVTKSAGGDLSLSIEETK